MFCVLSWVYVCFILLLFFKSQWTIFQLCGTILLVFNQQRMKCLAQLHNAVTQVRLEPATPSVSSQALYHWATDLLCGFYVRPLIYYSVSFQFRNHLDGKEGAGSWCLVTISALWLFLMVLCVGLQCVTVVHVFPDHTHLRISIFCSIHTLINV